MSVSQFCVDIENQDIENVVEYLFSLACGITKNKQLILMKWIKYTTQYIVVASTVKKRN